MSKTTVRDFSFKFRSMLGDGTFDVPDEFIINGINWAFNELPLVPKLVKIFSKHKQVQLDAKGHWRWNLNGDFRRLLDIPMMNFWTSTGGDICKLNVCHRDVVEFYNKNGIINLKKEGQPCEYTIEQEDDNIWLVFDRPLNVPVIIDYIGYGFPAPVSSMDDTIEISAIAENLVLDVLRTYWYREADDFQFAGSIMDYLDNKKLPEAIQAINRRWGVSSPIVLGER